ncbi:MAG: NAD(P)-dependent oxidoreductase [Anaerolineae bacterium]
MNDKPVVGFIGLGVMGEPMARNVLKAGFRLVVHNRSRGKVDALVVAGAEAGGSPRGVAERAKIVLMCLPDAPDVQKVMAGPDGVLAGISPGQVIVDMSTSSASLARELAAQVAALGATLLDAPVSGGEIGAKQGTLSIMVGGDLAALERARPVLLAMGKTIVHVGEAGAGQVCKSCNQIVVALTMAGVAEALLLAAKAGVDPAKVREVLLGGAAQSRVLEQHGQRMLDRNFAPGFRARLQHKDLRLALGAGRDFGSPLPLTSLVHEFFTGLVATGRGDLDHAALYELLETLGKVAES